MSRGFSLRGAAAGAFVNAMMGKAPDSEEDKQMRIATFIHMEMKRNNKDGEHKARLIVKCVAKEGIDKALEIITGIKTEAAPPEPPSDLPAPARRPAPRRKTG